MTPASVFTRDLLLIANGVWLDGVLARRFGRVPEGVPDLTAVLESAAGRGFVEESVSTLSVDVRLSVRRDDGAWEARHPLWYAADFEGEFGGNSAGIAPAARNSTAAALWRGPRHRLSWWRRPDRRDQT